MCVAEVSDKIPTAPALLATGLVLAGVTYALCRTGRYGAIAAFLLAAAISTLAWRGVFLESPDLKKAVVAEQGPAYFPIFAISAALPMAGAVWGCMRPRVAPCA
jgi:hypothetical protein